MQKHAFVELFTNKPKLEMKGVGNIHFRIQP